MNRFSIRDIENLTGIKAHTLRIWEQRYGIVKPKRTDTNIRYYDGNDLKQALRVALLNHHGYKISRIQNMSEEEINRLLQETADSGFQFQFLLNKLLEATIDMDTEKFESLLNKYIKKFGIEQAVEQLLFAFLEKIGIMWMSNRIFPAQEHLVTNIVTRKILMATERLPPKMSFTQSKFLLFLPEGEIHELGLLYMQYQLMKYNKNVLYLGANTPLADVHFVCKAQKPQYLYTHITSVSNDFDIHHYLNQLANIHPSNKIFVSGSLAQKEKISDIPHNVIFLTTLYDTKNTLVNIP